MQTIDESTNPSNGWRAPEALAAKVLPDMIPIFRYDAEHDIITLRDIDYSNCKTFFKMVLEFNGKVYTFSAWNSDRGYCYFKQGAAVVARRRR